MHLESYFAPFRANIIGLNQDFESFCAAKGIRIARRAHLAGNWHTPCRTLPNLLAGYALYDLAR